MTPSPDPSRNNVAGIIALTGANACYVVNDTLVKLVGADLPVGEIILLRGLIASAVIVVAAAALGAFKELHLLASWPAALRVLGEVGAAVFYLTALMRMPIANAMAVLQAVPLVATIAAIPLLGEEVGWRRWVAVGIGLFGVLLIIRPGFAGFNTASLFALAAVAFVVLRDFATRSVAPGVSTLGLTAFTTVAVTALGLGMMPFETPVLPTTEHLALLAAAAIALLGAYALTVVAVRLADISAIGPFRYTMVPMAVFVGFVVWRDVPDLAAGIGILLVIGAGIYAFLRERRLSGGG